MFLKGLILGFSVAAPVGPIGLLCIQRTLSHGRRCGFVSGLGAASADALYGLIAALGLSAVTSFLLGVEIWLQVGGGLFLFWLGGRLLFTKPKPATPSPFADKSGLVAAYVSVSLLTLANPATILSFIAIFAGLGINRTVQGSTSALALVAGVFLGSAAWWCLLSFLAGSLRAHLNEARLRLVNVGAGLSILALGLWSLWPLVAAKLL